MSGDWLEVTVSAQRSQVEELEGWFFDAGALSVTLRDSDEDDDLAHAVLEPVIRAHPEQYLWVHNRYKTRPPEE